MKFVRSMVAVAATLFVSFFTVSVSADVNTVAVGGFDTVSYQQGAPVRGAGELSYVYEGATYLFSTKANLKAFKKDPAKYIPAYGGYCAYGASVGKKFQGDPTVWKVVDGTLYLNLSQDVSKIWNRDIPGNIASADEKWKTIANIPAADL